jgi:hypothetical protein
MLTELIKLQELAKKQADFHHNLGNFDARDHYDSIAKGLDTIILDLMVKDQEQRVSLAVVV